MIQYLDVDIHQLIQAPGARTPADTIVFKIQDTPSFNLYLTSGGKIQDYGESPVIEFALNAAPPAGVSLLVDDPTFTRQVDANGQAFYQAFPLFNTTEMATALGSATSFNCVGEIRVQFASGEKFSSRDIPFTIWRTILGGTGTTTPVGISSYPDVALIELKSNRDQKPGTAALDSLGFLNPTDYNPNVVVLQSMRDAAGGHPGLDSQSLLNANEIPADGSTIVVTPSIITRNGTTTSGSAVVTGLSATADLTRGEPMTGTGVPGATTLLSIDSPSQITMSAVATASGTVPLTFTVQKISAVGPAQGVLAITLSNFTVPAVGANETINVPTGSLTEGLYYNISGGAGIYQLASITDLTHADFTNLGGAQNAAVGTVIDFPVNVTWSGPPGPSGGGGLSCEVTTAVTLPSVGTNLNIEVDNGNPFIGIGSVVAIVVPGSTTNYGYWLVNGVDSTHVNLANDARWPAASAGTTLPVGARIILIDIYEALTAPNSAISGMIEAPTAKTYTLQLIAPTIATLARLLIKTLSGTCTAALNIDGSAATNLGAVSVTSTLQNIASFTAISGTGLIELVISSPSTPVDLSYTLIFTYPVLF